MVPNGRFFCFVCFRPQDHHIQAELSTSPRLSAECPTKTSSPKSGSDKNPPPSLVTPSLGGAHQGLDLPGDASPATTSESILVFPANALVLPHTMTLEAIIHKIMASKEKKSTPPRRTSGTDLPAMSLSSSSPAGGLVNPPHSVKCTDKPGDGKEIVSDAIPVFPANALDHPHTMTPALFRSMSESIVANQGSNIQRSPLRLSSYDDVSDQSDHNKPPTKSGKGKRKSTATKQKVETKKPKVTAEAKPGPSAEEFRELKEQFASLMQLLQGGHLPMNQAASPQRTQNVGEESDNGMEENIELEVASDTEDTQATPSQQQLLRLIAELSGGNTVEIREKSQLPSLFSSVYEQSSAEPTVRLESSDTAKRIYDHLNGVIRDTEDIAAKSAVSWTEKELAALPPPGDNALSKAGVLLAKRNSSLGVEHCVLADHADTTRARTDKMSGTITDAALSSVEWDCTAAVAANTHVEQSAVAIINQLFDLLKPEEREKIAIQMKPLLEGFNNYVLSSSFHAIRSQANVRLLRRDIQLKDYKTTAAAKLRIMPIDDAKIIIGTKTVSEAPDESEMALKLKVPNKPASSAGRTYGQRNNKPYVRRSYNNSQQQYHRSNYRRNNTNYRPYRRQNNSSAGSYKQRQNNRANASKKH